MKRSSQPLQDQASTKVTPASSEDWQRWLLCDEEHKSGPLVQDRKLRQNWLDDGFLEDYQGQIILSNLALAWYDDVLAMGTHETLPTKTERRLYHEGYRRTNIGWRKP